MTPIRDQSLPLVSVLTPCYNNVHFIESCVQSVLSQKYLNVEHIVQDGKSTDGTLDILKKYTGKINWVSEKDSGQSDGLNRALQRCHGEIIGVLNSDDEYLPHALEWVVENFAKYPNAAVIYGQQYNIDPVGNIIDITRGPDPYQFERIFCCQDVIPAQAAFIRRKAFEQVGFYADVTRKTCPDYEMWIRIGLKFPMMYIPGVVANYRIHPGSEGQQDKVIHGMVRSKREVVDRTCDDPETPLHIQKMRRRAHAGILEWSTAHFLPPIRDSKKKQALIQMWKSLMLYPTPGRILAYLWSLCAWNFCKWNLKPVHVPSFDLKEKTRVMIRLIRETGRKLDRILFREYFYKRAYLRLKPKLSKPYHAYFYERFLK